MERGGSGAAQQADDGPPSRRLRKATMDEGPPSRRLRTSDERYAVVLYAPPAKLPRVAKEIEDRPTNKSTWTVPAALKGSGCSKCRWSGCRSCPDAGSKQPITAIVHKAPPAPATKTCCGRCANCLDMKRFGGPGTSTRMCQYVEADESPISRAIPRALPPGWSAVAHTSPNRIYKTYHGPGGETARSTLEAWRRHREPRGAQAGEEEAEAEKAEAAEEAEDTAGAGEATPPAKRQKVRREHADKGPPALVLPHGRAQAAGLRELRDLGEAVPLLRRQIVSATPRRGVHDTEQTCMNRDLASLLGVRVPSFKNLFRALLDGRLPAKLKAPDGTWVVPAECAARLHDVRFWVQKRGIVEIDSLHEKLAGQSAARREEAQARKQPLASPLGARSTSNADVRASSDANAPKGALALHWRNEEDELKRAVMVSALPCAIWPA